MARERLDKARDRAVESSWFAPMLGAGIGALVAKALQSRAQERGWDGGGRDDRRYGARWEAEGGRYGYGDRRDQGYAPYGEYEFRADTRARDEALHGGAMHGGAATEGESGSDGIREKASQATAQVGEKLSGMAESARHRAGDMKERIQETASSMRERLPDRDRIRTSTREDTGLWALGAAALGALFGFALPASDRERELLEPARRKARELGQEVRDRALEKGSEVMEKATEKVKAAGEQGTQEGQQEESSANPAPLH